MKRQNKLVRVVFVALGVGLALGVLPAAAGQGPPYDVSGSITFAPGDVCAFGVELSQTGKGKAIVLPGGNRFIFTSPKLNVTLTNLDNSKQVSLNVTGPFHQTTELDGKIVTVSTGRSLLYDPDAGFVLAVGRFSFVFDASGNLIQPLSGIGQLINVCALIE